MMRDENRTAFILHNSSLAVRGHVNSTVRRRNMKRLLVLALLIISVGSSLLAQEPKSIADDDALRKVLERIEQLLTDHYQPMIPVANYRPFVKAKFEPAKFVSCTLKYKLDSVPAKGSSYILNTEMNLADLDPAAIDISRDLKRDDRWFISFQTMNNSPKIHVTYRNAVGRVMRTGSFMSPHNGFDADGRDTAQEIAALFRSAIKYCSEKR